MVRRVAQGVAPVAIFFVIIIVGWSVAVIVFDLPTYMLPSPARIMREMSENLPVFTRNGAVTLLEAIGGYILGGTIGILLGTLLSLSKFLERGFLPYIIGATTVPIVAFAPLVVVYVGMGIESKIIVAAIVCFFPLCLNTLKGLLSTDLTQRDLFYSLAASRWQVFSKLMLPTSLPYITTAMKQTSTRAVIAAIIAEYIQANQGFGFLILQSSYVMDIPRMWAAVIFSSLVAMAFYIVVLFVEQRLTGWHVSMIEQRR
jgi:NitT/TauT family transport system permease protein